MEQEEAEEEEEEEEDEAEDDKEKEQEKEQRQEKQAWVPKTSVETISASLLPSPPRRRATQPPASGGRASPR